MHRRAEDDLRLREALRSLPRRDPPEAVWQRIEAGLHSRAVRRPGYARWLPLALAASVIAAVLIVQLGDRRLGRAVDASPAAAALASSGAEPADLDALVAESAQIERVLSALPRYDGVVRVGAAGTIAGLEDHIAWIDAELSAGEALGADPAYRRVLWQERVELMSVLLDVQVAQLPERVLVQ
jgi:hypothetical protein